jgi:hypothetical protein
MMIARPDRIWMLATLALGLSAGWLVSTSATPRLKAGGSDRWNDRVVTTGTAIVERDRQGQRITQDGLYVLNYSNGLLLAALPAYEQSSTAIRYVSDFAERDLVQDFALAPGSRPHFLMTTIEMGSQGDGTSPLLVFETETGQMATYRVVREITSGTTRPKLQLLERRTDPRLARTAAAAATAAPSGSAAR